MHIFVNDLPVICQDHTTITTMLQQQDIVPFNIAVAIDNIIIPKDQWETMKIRDGSKILIIKAVQGG